MSDFKKFQQIVWQSPELQAELQSIPDLEALFVAIINQAQFLKLEIEDTDLQNALSTARQAWIERWVG